MREREREMKGKNMKKRKDKRGADIANVKSRKMRKMVTQLLSEDVFIYFIFFFSLYQFVLFAVRS